MYMHIERACFIYTYTDLYTHTHTYGYCGDVCVCVCITTTKMEDENDVIIFSLQRIKYFFLVGILLKSNEMRQGKTCPMENKEANERM